MKSKESIAPLAAQTCFTEGCPEVWRLFHFFLHEVRDHFCICFREKAMPLVQELIAEFLVVLDDAVVDDRDCSVTGKVRMCVLSGDSAMRRPARVGDRKRRGRPECGWIQVAYLADIFAHLHRFSYFPCYSPGIVSAVLEVLDALKHQRTRVAPRHNVSGNSTHGGHFMADL